MGSGGHCARGRAWLTGWDALTRLNRSVGQVMISHTMSDLLALPAEDDRMKARGFVERSGMVICGGLPASEMPLLTAAIPLTRQEQQKLISWQDPPVWDSRGGDVEPPGRGKFRLVPDRESPDLDPRIRRGPADQR